MIESTPESRPGCRRYFQFSLRTIVILMGAVGATLGFWQSKVTPIRRQWQAVEPLLQLGVTVETEPNDLPKFNRTAADPDQPKETGGLGGFLRRLDRWIESRLFEEGRSGHIVAMTMNRKLPKAEDIRRLRQLPRLRRLDLEQSGITDDHCIALSTLDSLEHLSLWGNPITDEGAEWLSALESLKFLDLNTTECTWRSQWFFRERPGIEVRLTQWLFSYIDVLPGEVEKLKECGREVSGVNLLFATDAALEELVSAMPDINDINLVVRDGLLTEKSLEEIFKLNSWRVVNFLFPGTEDHYYADEFRKQADGGGAIDYELIRKIAQRLGPVTKELRMSESGKDYRLSFVMSSDVVLPRQFGLIIPTEKLSEKFVESLGGLEKIPQLRLVGQPRKGPLAITSATPGIRHLILEPLGAIGDYFKRFAELTQLETIEIDEPSIRLGLQIADDFFEALTCQESLKELKLSQSFEVTESNREILKEFSKLSFEP